MRGILRCDDLSGEDIAGRQESNRFAPSNKSLQPIGLWRCASMPILTSVFSTGAQPRFPERWLSSVSLDVIWRRLKFRKPWSTSRMHSSRHNICAPGFTRLNDFPCHFARRHSLRWQRGCGAAERRRGRETCRGRCVTSGSADVPERVGYGSRTCG